MSRERTVLVVDDDPAILRVLCAELDAAGYRAVPAADGADKIAPMPRILLTGATGYIGSHTWLALYEAGFDVVGVDNFANSSPRVLERLAELSRRTPAFERVDVCDEAALDGVFARHAIDAVVHFAAHKAVGESVQKPIEYYRNNIGGLINTTQVMQAHGVHTMVFSSSATVYGHPDKLPITEDAPLAATNPYGTTKLMGEQLLRDLERNQPQWRISYLRYFNPVGAHPSGRIGEHDHLEAVAIIQIPPHDGPRRVESPAGQYDQAGANPRLILHADAHTLVHL